MIKFWEKSKILFCTVQALIIWFAYDNQPITGGTVDSNLISFILANTIHQMAIFSMSRLPRFTLAEPLFQIVVITVTIHPMAVDSALARTDAATFFLTTFYNVHYSAKHQNYTFNYA